VVLLFIALVDQFVELFFLQIFWEQRLPNSTRIKVFLGTRTRGKFLRQTGRQMAQRVFVFSACLGIDGYENTALS
jgi:hypothetical protein